MDLTLLQSGGGEGMNMTSLLMIVLMFGVFYWFLIRPQNKKRKEAETFRQGVSKGDRVVTIGGIHGKITSVQESTVVISVEDGAKLRIEKSAISMDASGQMTEDAAKQAT